MSDTGFTIDAEAFGLPTGVNGESTPAFMYDDGVMSVDENDPIYQATVEAMRARGIEIPKPGEEERPPAMPTTAEELDAAVDNPVPPSPGDAAAGDEPPATEPTTDPAPATEPVIPDADDTDGDETPPAARELAFQVDGQDITLNTEQAEYLLRVNSWLENIPEETKVQWAQIEQGTAVAISQEEYAALKAAATNPQPGSLQPRTPQAPDLDDLDDDTIEYIRGLEQRAATAPSVDAPAPGQQQPDVAAIAAAAQRQAEDRQQFLANLSTVNTEYAAKYNLNDEQMNRLSEVTASLQVIPGISRSLTRYSPTGQVIQQAPIHEVFTQAYDIAMGTDPTLRQIRDDLIYNQRVAAEAQRNAATNAKKAKAGTLASSPSAAVPANGQGLQISPDNKMDLQGTSAAIAKALTEMSEQS